MPGLPLAPFVLLGVLTGVAALLAARARPGRAVALDEPGADTARGPRLALRVSPDLHATLASRTRELHDALAAARTVASTAGVPIPPLSIVQDDALSAEVALAIDGTPVVWLAIDAADPIAGLRDKLRPALAAIVPELIGIDRVAALVERCAEHAGPRPRSHASRRPLPVLAEVLQPRARTGCSTISRRPRRKRSPAPAGGFTPRDTAALVEQLRGQLRRQITARWAPRGQLAVFTVDAMIEDAVRTAIDRRDGVAVLALEPAIAQDIVSAIRDKLGTGPAVILTSGDVRRHLRALLEPELPVRSPPRAGSRGLDRTAGRIEV